MTTEINVTVGPPTLLQQNRQQVDANRWRSGEIDSQQRTEAAARTARQQQLSQQGRTADGRLEPGTAQSPQFRRQKPAAFRVTSVQADFYVISYQFLTGEDLDTRTYLVNPVTNEPLGPVGWCKEESVVVNDVPILIWSGDNTDTGYESVLFDRVAYESQFPNQSSPVLLLNAFWYDIKGDAVIVKATGYKGGEMVLDEDLYLWSNPTAEKTWADFQTFTSTSVTTNISECIDGDYISNLQINYNAGTIRFYQQLP